MTKVALVTGGTRGIGAAISIALKNAGYVVAANYAGNDEAAKKFKEENDIAVFKWDVSDLEACKKGVAKAEKELGNIDVLVNNAGITRDAMLHKLSPENWGDVIKTNLDSCYNMCAAVVEGMRGRKFGRVVNVSSINALAGQMGQTNYCAAKAGMIGFTKALAREGAFKGITANVIAPGYIKTDMTADVPEKFMAQILAQIPVGRLGNPEEIARAVVFLAADDAGFITGETLNINGGHYMA